MGRMTEAFAIIQADTIPLVEQLSRIDVHDEKTRNEIKQLRKEYRANKKEQP